MLLELGIRNLAIVAEAVLPVGAGLTVITGETGAGKSLLLDALHLVLGGRGRSDLVGPAGDAAVVWASFEIDAALAQKIADGHGLLIDSEEPLVLRRRLQGNGRSTAWINDQSVTLQALRQIGHRLVDVRVQHEHLRLADRSYQMQLLDRYGQHEELAQRYQATHERCLNCQRTLQELHDGAHDSQRELEFCEFQLRELDDLQPEAGEVARLEEQQQLLAGAEEYRHAALAAADALEEGEAALVPQVSRLARRLSDMPQEHLQQAGQVLLDGEALLTEAAAACRQAEDAIRVDPEALARIDQRLGDYHRLLRKHGGDEERLLAAWRHLQQRVVDLSSVDQRCAQIAKELQELDHTRSQLGQELNNKRQRAAAQLFKQVEPLLAHLAMPHAKLDIQLDGEEPGPDGLGMMTLIVATNPGLPPGPLGSIPSGGESARLTLALAAALAAVDHTPVMVFDEVDNGVGGRLGVAIGQQLAALSEGRSVVAVTHTPQVAACAENHLVVRKQQSATSTKVSVDALAVASRAEEIAAMLGEGTAALEQARELLKRGGRS
jgi:DNA repair protein RecN (Recombination protein N)